MMRLPIGNLPINVNKIIETYTPCALYNCEAKIAVIEDEDGAAYIDMDHWNNSHVRVLITKDTYKAYCSLAHFLEVETRTA